MGEDKKYTPPTIKDGLKTLKLEDLSLESIAKLPCARTAFITGLSGGLIVGTLRYFGTRRGVTSGRWAILTFGIGSTVAWEFCRFQRETARQELQKMEYQNRLKNNNGL